MVVNGVPCAVASVVATSITCVTGARPPPPAVTANSFLVTAPTAGAFVLPASVSHTPLFRYLDRWSDLRTWLNQVRLECLAVVVEGLA